jgi:hypothetical protein
MIRRFLLLTVVGLLVVTAPFATAGATPPNKQSSTSGTVQSAGTAGQTVDTTPPSPPNGTLHISKRNATTAVLTYDFDIPTSVNQFRISFRSPAVVTEATGFDITANQNQTELVHTGSRTASVTVVLDARSQRSTGDFCVCIATSDWLMTSMPSGTVSYTSNGSFHGYSLEGFTRETGITANASFGTSGYASSQTLYVGPTTVTSQPTEGGTVNVVIPTGTTPRVSPATAANLIADSSRTLDTGTPRPDRVSVFVIPDLSSLNSTVYFGRIVPGGVTYGSTILVAGYVTESVYTHEYVHARAGQHRVPSAFPLTQDTRWLSEAFADYYGSLLAYQHGSLTWEDFYEGSLDIQSSHRLSALDDPSTWHSVRTPYQKGGLVLAALDVRIRTLTDGEHSLEDVFRRLTYQRTSAITMAEFKTAVSAVVGRPVLNDTIDRWVTTDAAPVVDEMNWTQLRNATPDDSMTPTGTPSATPSPPTDGTTTSTPADPSVEPTDSPTDATPIARRAGAFLLALEPVHFQFVSGLGAIFAGIVLLRRIG